MRTIEITTDVFAKIWSLRVSGEEDENTILRRVLGASEAKGGSLSGKSERIPGNGHSGRILWRDDVRAALIDLGGQAHLSEIYAKVRELRRVGGRSLPFELEAIVRRELENNSSDAGAFTGHRDWFGSVDGLGKGLWAIRTAAGHDK